MGVGEGRLRRACTIVPTGCGVWGGGGRRGVITFVTIVVMNSACLVVVTVAKGGQLRRRVRTS